MSARAGSQLLPQVQPHPEALAWSSDAEQRRLLQKRRGAAGANGVHLQANSDKAMEIFLENSKGGGGGRWGPGSLQGGAAVQCSGRLILGLLFDRPNWHKDSGGIDLVA